MLLIVRLLKPLFFNVIAWAVLVVPAGLTTWDENVKLRGVRVTLGGQLDATMSGANTRAKLKSLVFIKSSSCCRRNSVAHGQKRSLLSSACELLASAGGTIAQRPRLRLFFCRAWSLANFCWPPAVKIRTLAARRPQKGENLLFSSCD